MTDTVNGYFISFTLSETPGLGMKAKVDDFYESVFQQESRFLFKYTKSEAKADNEINAISSAT